MKKIKAFYIVFKHDFKHPHWIKTLREYKAKKIKKPSQYEIWREFDATIIWNSPIYKVLDYFDTKEEAKNFVKLQRSINNER